MNILNNKIKCKIYNYIYILYFRELYPRIIPRIIFIYSTRKYISEIYLESYPPLMYYVLLGTEFSERAIYL